MSPDDIIEFLTARLDEDELDTMLFHEFACTAHPATPGPPSRSASWPPGCSCPAPRRLLEQVWLRRRIVSACERRLASGHTVEQLQILGALTLTYELHPHWQESWRP